MTNPVTYNAFISYRHCDTDKVIAEAIHKFLEEYRIPGKLAKNGLDRKSINIFRDREELSSSGSLADNITHALHNSEFIILICSTETPKSIWVEKEVETFISLDLADKIIPVLIDGSPEESFPQPLIEYGKTHSGLHEYIDLRSNDLIGSLELFRIKKHSIAARLLNCDYDTLVKEKQKKSLQKRALIFTLTAAVLLTFGVISYFQLHSAIESNKKIDTLQQTQLYDRDKVIDAKNDVLQVITQLTYDVPNKISGINGTADGIQKMLEANINLLDRINEIEIDNEIAQQNQGYSYILKSDNYNYMGQNNLAEESLLKSIQILEKVYQKNKKDQFSNLYLSIAYSKLGYYKMLQSDLSSAEELTQKCIKLCKAQVKSTKLPNDYSRLAIQYENDGYILIREGKTKAASTAFKKGYSTASGHVKDENGSYAKTRSQLDNALAYIISGKKNKAMSVYKKILPANTDHIAFIISSSNRDAILLRSLGYQKEALLLYDCMSSLPLDTKLSNYIRIAKSYTQANGDLKKLAGGIYIYTLVDHQPAKNAGMIEGDIIIQADGLPVLNSFQLKSVIVQAAQAKPVKSIQIKYLRLQQNGTFKTYTCTVKPENEKIGIGMNDI